MLNATRTAASILLLTLVWAGMTVGQEMPAGEKEAPKPREFHEDVVKAADALRQTYPDDQQAIVNALRYLLRPEFENELLAGRSRPVCVLPPFDDESEESLSTLEALRVLAVLRSGMKVSSSAEQQALRLLNTPVPAAGRSLAQHAILMLVAHEAVRLRLMREADMKARGKLLLEAAEALPDLTTTKAPEYSANHINMRWFANHLWRFTMARAALGMGLEVDTKLLDRDIAAFVNAYSRNRGWVCMPKGIDPARDLHSNLIATAVIGLAAGLPGDTLNRTGERALARGKEHLPAVLASLETEGAEAWAGARLLLALSAAPDVAPERKSPDEWRADLLRRSFASHELSGQVNARNAMAQELGLVAENSTLRGEVATCETALSCLAMCGGLLPRGMAPLHGRELQSIGRIMYAQAVIQGSRARIGTDDFNGRVKFAIEDGCAWLASIQKADGSFPGQNSYYPGNTAMALLAMLHGGWSRDSSEIQAGLKWLESHGSSSGRRTYSHAVVLMFFQKYYEPEQREAGILYVRDAAQFEDARRKVWRSLKTEHSTMIAQMVKDIDDAHVGGTRGGWGYDPTGRGGGMHSDNSCSQYAMLGYKAASLLGAEVDTKLLTTEAERLIKQYSPMEGYEAVEYTHTADEREGDEKSKRKTDTFKPKKIMPGGWAYACSQSTYASLQLTGAGISSLTICMDELKIRGKLPVKLAEEIGLTIRGAESLLRHNYYKPSDFEPGPQNYLSAARSRDGWGTYYNLYSVERGCVLANIHSLEGEVDWYKIGAIGLLEHQNSDGSWGAEGPGNRGQGPHTINVCMAILFLKMAAMPVITEHKKREVEREAREKDGGGHKGPVTGEPKPKPKPAE